MTSPTRLLILPYAKADIGASAQRFDDARPGYGQLFIQQVLRTIHQIREFPESHQHFRGNCRRAIVYRFHHAVVYRSLPAHIEIVGVIDDRRDPSIWIPRTGS